MSIAALPLLALGLQKKFPQLGYYVAGAGGLQSLYGAYVFTEFVVPFIFPNYTGEGPKLNGLPFNGADEGLSVNIAYGRTAKMGAQLVYLSELYETENEHSTNGKGGGGGTFVEFTYSVDIGLGWCEGPAEELLALWSNGKIVYSLASSITYASAAVTGTASQVGFLIPTGLPPPNDYQTVFKYVLQIDSAPGGPDLSQFRVGEKLTISSGPTNDNGSWNVFAVKLNADGSSWVRVERYQQSGFTVFSSWSSGAYTPTLTQALSLFSLKNMGAPPAFYRGTEGQDSDPTLQALEGAANVNAMRGLAWSFLRNYQLIDSGNIVPNFEGLLRMDGAETDATAIAKMMRRSGYADAEFDVSAIGERALMSFVQRGGSPTRPMLAQVMFAFEVVSWEDGDVVRFLYRKDAEVVNIDPDLVGVMDSPRHVGDTSLDELVLPSAIVLSYDSAASDYQRKTAVFPRASATIYNPLPVTIPMVLEDDHAAELAERMMWGAFIEARRMDTQFPPSLVGVVHPAMVGRFTVDGRERNMFMTRVDVGDEWPIAAEGFDEEREIFDVVESPPALALAEGGGASRGGGAITGTQHLTSAPQPIELHLMDCCSLSEEHQQSPGLYVAGGVSGRSSKFTGYALLESTDGIDWRVVHRATEQAVIGVVLDPPGADADADEWDHASVLRVRLNSGAIDPTRVARCLAGRNRAMVGREIIGFVDVEQVDDETFEVRTLIRGMRDTWRAISQHEAGERFVLLDGPGIHFHALNPSSIGTPRHFRAVSSGAPITSAPINSHIPLGSNVAPMSPCGLRLRRDPSSGDVEATWRRRTRSLTRPFSDAGYRLLEREERYVVEWTDGADVLRTVEVTTGAATYTLAERASDGLGPSDTVGVRVSQVGDYIRRGNAAEATT